MNSMKKLTIIIFSLMFSINSYGEWTKILPGDNASLYIDFTTLIEKDGYINWWYLDTWDKGSETTYAQGDCNLKGFRVTKRVRFSLPMGEGEGVERDINGAWEYYEPNTGFEILLSFICQMSKLSPEEQSERIQALTKNNQALDKKQKEYVKKLEEKEISPELKIIRSAYLQSVEEKIKTFWSYDEAKDDWSCDVLINQATNGAVEAVKILECRAGNNENQGMSKSKAQVFGNSIRRAVFKSSPLPLPSEEVLFDRELIIQFNVN